MKQTACNAIKNLSEEFVAGHNNKIKTTMTRKILLPFLSVFVLLSCSKSDDIKTYDYEATIVGAGDDCSHIVLNVKNISGDSQIQDGVFFAMELSSSFTGHNPFSGVGYEGTRIKFNGSLLKNLKYDCGFMGMELPYIRVTKAVIAENQERGIDQRRINNDTVCLPYTEVFGTNQHDINQDDKTDIEFRFYQWDHQQTDSVKTYSHFGIRALPNLLSYTGNEVIPSFKGDTIQFDGTLKPEWDYGFDAGKYLLRYNHNSKSWEETQWKFGEAVYLKLLLDIEEQYHTAWIHFRIDLEPGCRCSVTVLDSYYNPNPNESCVTGYKE